MLRKGVLAAVVLALAAPAAAQDKKPPYWASIASGEAMMRAGPGRNYPGVWLYKRRDLPVRVVKIFPNWRMIEDSEGARGVFQFAALGQAFRIEDAAPRRVAPAGNADADRHAA